MHIAKFAEKSKRLTLIYYEAGICNISDNDAAVFLVQLVYFNQLTMR